MRVGSAIRKVGLEYAWVGRGQKVGGVLPPRVRRYRAA